MQKEKLAFFYMLSAWVLAVLLSCIVFGPLSGTLTSSYHARMVELFRSQGFATYDNLSYGGRLFSYYPLGYFLAGGITRVVPPNIFYILFPAVNFSAFLFLIYKIHRKFSNTYSAMIVTLLIATFAYSSFGRFFIDQLSFVLAVLAVYLALNKRFYLAGIISALTFLAHAESFLFIVLFFIAYSFKDRKVLISLLMGIFLALPYYIYFLQKFNWYIPFLNPEYRWIVRSYWTDVTPGIVNLLKLRYFLFIGFAGAISYMRVKFYPALIIVGSIFVFSGSRFIDPLGIIFFSIPTAAFISGIKKRKVLYYAVLLYTLLYLGYAVSTPLQVKTGNDLMHTLNWIKENTSDNTTVIASIGDGHLITYYAKRKDFADGLFEYANLTKAKLDLLAFRGNKSYMKKIINTSYRPRVFLVKKQSRIYQFLRDRFNILYKNGSYVVLGDKYD